MNLPCLKLGESIDSVEYIDSFIVISNLSSVEPIDSGSSLIICIEFELGSIARAVSNLSSSSSFLNILY